MSGGLRGSWVGAGRTLRGFVVGARRARALVGARRARALVGARRARALVGARRARGGQNRRLAEAAGRHGFGALAGPSRTRRRSARWPRRLDETSTSARSGPRENGALKQRAPPTSAPKPRRPTAPPTKSSTRGKEDREREEREKRDGGKRGKKRARDQRNLCWIRFLAGRHSKPSLGAQTAGFPGHQRFELRRSRSAPDVISTRSRVATSESPRARRDHPPRAPKPRATSPPRLTATCPHEQREQPRTTQRRERSAARPLAQKPRRPERLDGTGSEGTVFVESEPGQGGSRGTDSCR